MQTPEYPKEVDWPSHTATLRAVKRTHYCTVCHEPVEGKAYVVTIWNSGLAGRKFPTYLHPEHLAEYRGTHGD